MRTTIHLILATIVIGAPAVHAQQTPSPGGSPVITSSPGKVSAIATAEATATVTAVDKATRKITLKGPKGNNIDVVASDEVKNFDQIRVGDNVAVRYREALTLELKKTTGGVGATEAAVASRSAPGERPGGFVGREVTVVAEVVAVDPAKSIISLKGPNNNVVDLKVKNPDHFKVVKKGDQVEAVYTEAIAVAVTPASKPAAK